MQKIIIKCTEEEAAPIGIYLMQNRIEFSAQNIEADEHSHNNDRDEICPVTKKPCGRAKGTVVCESAYGTCEHQGKLPPLS